MKFQNDRLKRNKTNYVTTNKQIYFLVSSLTVFFYLRVRKLFVLQIRPANFCFSVFWLLELDNDETIQISKF